MADTVPNGRLRWQFWFEWVIVPMTGLTLIVYGATTSRVPTVFIPVLVGLVGFPFARTLDKLRRDS